MGEKFCPSSNREKPESHAAVLDGTLFLGRTVALTGSIFELAELADPLSML